MVDIIKSNGMQRTYQSGVNFVKWNVGEFRQTQTDVVEITPWNGQAIVKVLLSIEQNELTRVITIGMLMLEVLLLSAEHAKQKYLNG